MMEMGREKKLQGLGDACVQKRQARQNLFLRDSGTEKRKGASQTQSELCVNSKGSFFFFLFYFLLHKPAHNTGTYQLGGYMSSYNEHSERGWECSLDGRVHT